MFLIMWCSTSSAAVVAVNAGGSSYTAADGTTFGADTYFTGGSTYSVANAISGTQDDTLYQSLRYGYGNDFSCNIPISNGNYDVTLKFAELYYDNIDDQVFSVSIERTEVLGNLDILEHVGKFEAYDVTVPSVTVNDGELNITFAGASDATICAIEVNLAASSVNISADPFQIDPGQSSTLSWNSSNADTVSIDNGIGEVDASGFQSVSPTVTTTYTITADGPGGTAQNSTTVVVNSAPPTVGISANPVYIAEGGTTTLTWTSTDATSASINNGVGDVDASGTTGVSPSGTGVITYIITVTGPGGTAQDSVDVTVNPLPTVSIASDRTNIAISESATITWSSSDADTVSVQPIDSSALSGSDVVTPAVTTTYTITASNAYGSREASVTIMVDQSAAVTIQAAPTSIVNGSSSTLTWTSDGADTVSIDPGIGLVALNGSLSVTPAAETQYTITATNAYGSATDTVTITVSDPSTASITASTNPINAGESTTLTWSSTNADSATIDPVIGTAPVNGSESVSPAETTTYTLTVDGPGGVATHSVTVTVNQPPIVSMSADPGYIGAGDSASLNWTTTNADSAIIEPGIGAVEVNDSISVSPAETTTYTITVDGPGGTGTASSTVTVHPIPIVNISADLTTINIGESATLTWTSADATTATINAFGHVALNGSVVVSPLVTTTYTITVEGYGGSASESITVSIASQMSVAVNCGGEAYTALDGTNYVADTYYTGGNVYSTSNTIAGTSDDELYQSQRYGYGSEFSYAIPLADWNYDITLRFAEMYYDTAGQQVFSVSAEGNEIITDLDILSQAGKYEAYDVTITSVNVADGVLDLTFAGINDAAICAIEVVPTPPTAGISASPNPLVEGQAAILTWNSADGTAASLDQGIGAVTPNVYSTTGVAPVTTTTYTITVDGPGGTATESVVLDVNNLPVVDIMSSSGAITEGGSATLSWTTSYTDTISIDQGVGDVTGMTSYTVSPVVTTTYTITAVNAYGSRTDSVTVNVNTLPVISSFIATPNPIIAGASTTLNWATTGATEVSVNNGVGTVAVNGTTLVSPTVTTTYTLTAINFYGSREAAVTVDVGEYPMVSISASPATIIEGSSSTLSWTSANADTASIDQGIISVTPNTSGLQSVSPVITTTYTITATNDDGNRTSTDSVTVTVNTLPVIDSFTTDSGTMTEETSATLSWTVTNADTASINQGIGPVSASAEQAVTPSVTTTYTLTATNIYGSRSSNVTIIVNELPTVSIFAMPASICEGESAALSWNTTNTDSASIEGIGPVSVNGSTEVSPSVTTSYIITATNTYGSRTDTVTVLVNNPPTIESFTAETTTITEGGSTILSWSSTGADFASIDQGIGSTATSGSTTVSPVVTTTYTLTVSNTHGSDTVSVTISVNNLPQTSIAALPETITEGESSTLSWTSSNADSVSIDGGVGAVTENTPGTQLVNPAVTTTYTITAINTFGTRTANVTVTVNNLPTVSISADFTDICAGSSAILTWSSGGADTLTINQGIGTVGASGSQSVTPAYDTTYTITATNAYGYASQSISITVNQQLTASISASPNPINEGESTTLSWNTTDATTVSIDQGVGPVAASGTTIVSPTLTTSYIITATSTCGDVTDSVTVTVYNAPTVTLSATPSTISEGDSSTLNWTSTNATSASIDQGIGPVDVNSSVDVSPTVTTTYTITVEGPAGTGTDSVTITVNELPIISSFISDVSTITEGESATLSWTSTGADSLTLDPGSIDVTGTTSYVASPVLTTSYTLTASNAYGDVSAGVTVTVNNLPTVSISAVPAAIAEGESASLVWTSTGADTLILDPGPIDVTGTTLFVVSPVVTTTYTITASNAYGERSDTAIVTVNALPTVSLSADPDAIIDGETSNLSWSSSDAQSVYINQGLGSQLINVASSTGVSPTEDTMYVIIATNEYGSRSASAAITVTAEPLLPSVDISAAPNPISSGETSILSWLSSSATTLGIEPDLGLGTLEPNVASTTGVSPTENTTYTITATNEYGSVSEDVTVVVSLPPVVSISASRDTITEGETTTLLWDSSAATISCTIDQGVDTGGATSGTADVTPTITTTYTVTAENAYGSTTDTVTVTVNPLPVIDTFTAAQGSINRGETTTLNWTTTYATSASIDQGIGSSIAVNGSTDVSPGLTTTYTITAMNANGSRTDSVTITVTQPPTVSISASSEVIATGSSTTLTWTSTDATSASIDQSIGAVAVNDSIIVTPDVTTTYTITAVGPAGSANDSVTVTVGNTPVVGFSADPEAVVAGNSSTLFWIVSGADSVSIDQGIGAVGSSGTSIVTPGATTTYTLTATNMYGNTVRTVTVSVGDLPTVSISASPETIIEDESALLSWTSTGASIVEIDQGIGSVPSPLSVSPTVTTTYTVTATNDYGSVTDSVIVTVNNKPIITSFTASPSTIIEGQSATLSWSTTGAGFVDIDQGVGSVGLNSSVTVSPLVTTVYTMTSTNTFGTRTASVTVVVHNLPTVSISSDVAAITEGNNATLTWDCTNAAGVSIDHGIGTVAASDSTVVSPVVTTTYTILATNAYGTRSDSVTITVNNLPEASISAMPSTIAEGASTTLTWNATSADSASIDQGIGAVAVSGSLAVSPSITTTYTITATNTNGTRLSSASVTVGVIPTVIISASPAAITEGGTTALTWSSTDATTVSIDHGIGNVTATGTADVSPTVTTTYTVIATNSYGTATDNVTVTVNNLPTVSISANPATITESETSTLAWTSSNADSVSIDQGIGAVTANTQGSQDESPSITTTYTITATNANGTVTDSVTVTVNTLPVINSFTTDSATIVEGESVNLSWATTGADSASIDKGIGAVAVSDTLNASPVLTTTYTLIAENAFGAVSESVTVTVNNLPTVSMSAGPAAITEGESSTLSWASTGEDSLSIDQSIGVVTGSEYSVSPVVTTTYTITATNEYGERSDTAVVTVNALPTVSLSADPDAIIDGETSNLTWSSSDAQSVYINQGLGSQLINVASSTGVSPTVDTTYIIIATNEYGSRSASETITVTAQPLPTVSISASPNPITSGGTSILSWMSSTANTLGIDPDLGLGTLEPNVASTTGVSLTENTTYTITATNEYGSVSDSVTVVVGQLPYASITASKDTITEGETTTLIWDSINAETCIIDQGVDTGGATSGTADVTPATTTTYTVTATHSVNGSTTASVTVSVNPLPTIDTFTATPGSINNGETATLSWTTTDAASVSIDQGIGMVAVDDSADVSPSLTTTYTITATNANGSRTDSVTVTVNQLPTVSISASPEVIAAGDFTTLTWTSANANTVSIDQNIGEVNQSGSQSVSPAVTTTYTISATNVGTVTDSVTITVGNLPTIDIFSATPSAIIQGGSSDLNCFVTNADTVSIDQGIGDVTGTTSYIVTPAATTTYTLTATNAYGSVTSSVTVTVGQLPSVDISESPETITEGETAILSWTSVNAESCSIDQGIGAVALSGSMAVTPSVTTVYTITATNTSGTATDSVNVTVNNLPVVSITAAPIEIIVGSSSTLTWTSSGADTISLSHGIGDVTGTTSYSVSPSFTTTYIVTATNEHGSVTDTATVTVYDEPTVSFAADPANIITGGLTTLTWTSTDATSASIDDGSGAVSVDVNSSMSVSPSITTTYTITVVGPGGTAAESVTVGVNDSIAVNITVSPAAIVSGEQTVLFWNSTGADSVSIDGGIGDVALDGWKNVSPAVTMTYTITATGDGGTVSDTATVTVSQGPAVNISAAPDTINEGESTLLTWTSTDADTASINNGIGAVEVNGSASVSPAVTTTYIITANGSGGTATSSVTVNVNGLPTVSISADPQAIAAGSSTTLTWTSTNADTASIDNGIDTAGATSGFVEVSPAVTTTYTITATRASESATDSVIVTVYPTPTVSISAAPNPINEGVSTTLSWTSTDATTASIDQGIGSVVVNGSTSVTPVVTTMYTITVTGAGGTDSASVTVTVNQLPNVSISASPNNIAAGGSTTLTWSSSNAASVSIDQGVVAVALSGSASVSPAVTTTYTVTATNTAGDTTDSVTVMVEEPPTVNISASPAEIDAGSQVVLSWNSSGADTVSINQGINAVALEGEINKTPAITTTYTITATNTYGTATDSVTVTVHPVPTVNITATPTVINIGQSSTLSWTSANATSASMDSGIGPVAVNGSLNVAPTVTTTYTITVTGSGGTATDSMTVNVNHGPTVSITADPSEMGPGSTSTLIWTSTNAISASIDQNIGTVSVNGSTTVTPAVTTTYTITAEGPGGSATESVTITISDAVAVSISAAVNTISLSQSTTLTWTSANAATASINQGIGAVPVNGSMIVTPASTKIYTITVDGPGGTETASVEVVVYQPPEVTLTAVPDRIIKGDPSTLTWTSLNATTVTIDSGIGEVALNGSQEVYPQIPTTYTITATGDWALFAATDTTTIGVVPREAAYIPTYTVVSGGYNYSIAVMDLEIPAITYTLDNVGNEPLGIIPHPSNDYIYVSCLRDQTVEKIDVFTGEKLAAIDVTDLPRDIAITPDGSTVYVSLHNNEYNGGQNIPAIGTATDTIVDTTSTPNDAKAIDMSPDGAWLYASSVYGHSSYDQTFYVSVFNTATNSDEAVINVDPYHPFDLVTTPDGSRVYIANLEEGLSYIDVDGDSFSFEGPAIVEADKQYIRLEISPDGTRLYAVTVNWRTYQSGISVIDTADNTLVATIPITLPYEWLSFNGIDIHPTEPELYVIFSDTAGTGLPDFYVIDTDTNTISNSLSIGRHNDIYGDLLIIRP